METTSVTTEEIADLIERFLSQYCLNTARSYRYDINAFAQASRQPVAAAFERLFFSSSLTQTDLVENYKQSIASSPLGTFRRRISILNNICRFAREEGMIREEIRITREVRRTPDQTAATERKRTVGLPESDIRKLRTVLAKDKTTHGLRDLAILDLLFFRHLEGCELVNLRKEDVDLRCQQIWIPRCRGGPTKRFDLAPESVASLSAWMRAHPDASTPFLFVRLDRGWKKVQAPMSPQGIKNMLQRRALEARVDVPITFRSILKTSTTNAMWREFRQGSPISEVFTFARRRTNGDSD